MIHPELTYIATVVFGTLVFIGALAGIVGIVWFAIKEAKR